ncbi:hypothetical protein BN874_1240007 [Candidatus Contendobacter odensis Run_B_J11]|uniref:Uncharacterized protein n=1 Tax=Candidatus Contendobacter odensis Run_B_J11 TaxID=1400861 RepID=A0A7U7J2R2_9GAMM|nr:hypothetical protein BN874_1240007 [Candidatus Contendobacter odensis Run_B_J11]
MIRIKLLISTDYWDAFVARLGNQHPVKWIFVMKWHIDESRQVLIGNRQQFKVVPQHVHMDETWVWRSQFKFFTAHLDGDFP